MENHGQAKFEWTSSYADAPSGQKGKFLIGIAIMNLMEIEKKFSLKQIQ